MTVLTITPVRERVAEGGRFWDGRRPGWAAEIDTVNLDLGDACWCIVGQLEGDYYEGTQRLWADGVLVGDSLQDAKIKHGFTAALSLDFEEFEDEFDQLQAAWQDEIARRVDGAREETS
jgi:hypothetical protein